MRTGVETYSLLWGRPRAVAAWLAAVLATAACAWQVARHLGLAMPIGIVLATLVLACVAAGVSFLRAPDRRGGKLIEAAAGIWTLLMYLSLGAVPLAIAVWRGRA